MALWEPGAQVSSLGKLVLPWASSWETGKKLLPGGLVCVPWGLVGCPLSH